MPWVARGSGSGHHRGTAAFLRSAYRNPGSQRAAYRSHAQRRRTAYFRGAASGFVVAGRSLREVERQEDNLMLIVGAAWLASLGATLAASFALVLMQAWRTTWQQTHPAATTKSAT